MLSRLVSSGLLLALALAGCGQTVTPLDAAAPDTGVALTDAARPDAGPPPPPPEDFDGYVAYQMAAGGIPGAGVAIVRPDGTGIVASYGFADVDSETPVDEHTLFIMASVSKTFAVTRAMQLVEAGLLDLDAPASDYLAFDLAHPSFPDDTITTRMLLTHVSGMEDDFATLAQFLYEGDPPVSMADFSLSYASPSGDAYSATHWGERPVTRRSYCNAAFGVVGAILEGAGDESLRTQTDRELLTAIDLDGAGWFLADVDTSRIAIPYGWTGFSYYPIEHAGFAFYPASSMRISLTGLIRFARMLMNGGELEGTRVLTQESVDEMFRIQYRDVSRSQALTFSERTLRGNLYIGHSGSTSGGSTNFLISRDMSHAIVLITNSDAYIRSRLGLNEGADAMDAILRRMADEAMEL